MSLLTMSSTVLAIQIIPQCAGDSLLAYSQAVAATFVNALWQGAIIAIGLAICLKFAARTSAALRFALWSAAFLLVAALPLLPAIQGAGVPVLATSGSNLPAHAWLQLDLRWSFLISAAWVAVSLYRVADLAVHAVRLRKLWKSAVPLASGMQSIHAALPLRARVEICTTRELDRPAVIGFFAPRILIPEWLMAQLTPGELDQIVLHESEHLRRGDDWTNLLQKLSLVLFPLNPVLIWMERQLCLEREMACDDGVIRVTHAPRAYAFCLTSLAERGMRHRTEALSLGVLRRRPELVQRVHSLLRRGQALGPVGSRTLAAGVLCSMAFGAVELSRCPQLIAFEGSPYSQANSAAVRNHEGIPSSAMTASLTTSGSPVKSPFRAVYTKAVEPAGKWKSFAAVPLVNKARTSSPKTGDPVPAASAEQTTQVVPVIARVTPHQPATQAETQDLIVLTTWRQESVTFPGNDSPDGSSDGFTSRIVVTRTIYRMIPAKGVTGAHPGPNSASPSPEPIPTLVPSRDGWLVLEL